MILLCRTFASLERNSLCAGIVQLKRLSAANGPEYFQPSNLARAAHDIASRKKSPGGVVTARDIKNAELTKITESEANSQTLTILQFSPTKKPRGWRKIFGRVVVRSNGEILLNAGILSPWAGLCALLDGVAMCVQGQPLLVPISWAIREYPQHAERLKALVTRLGEEGC